MRFTREDTLRQNLFTQGRFFDEVVFGLLASEFETLEAVPPQKNRQNESAPKGSADGYPSALLKDNA